MVNRRTDTLTIGNPYRPGESIECLKDEVAIKHALITCFRLGHGVPIFPPVRPEGDDAITVGCDNAKARFSWPSKPHESLANASSHFSVHRPEVLVQSGRDTFLQHLNKFILPSDQRLDLHGLLI